MPLSLLGITLRRTLLHRRDEAKLLNQALQLSESRRESAELRKTAEERGRDLARLGPQLAQFSDKLNATTALAAEKQREIGSLRSQLADKELQLKDERRLAREERQKLMDWIAKGVSGGTPIFAELPAPEAAAAEPEPKAPDPATERVPTELEDAVATVGRRARAIVKHIEHKKDVNFEGAMAAAGVRRIFDEDRVTAEVEAQAIEDRKRETISA
jgi:hypothetical protein